MNQWNQVTRLAAPGGASLAVRHLQATGKPKAIIHINHGMAEHAERYGRFAKALSVAGYHVYAHDHRGHGNTTAPDAPQGVFAARDGLEVVLEDIKAINEHARSNHPGLPVVYFGHSMGGILGTAYCIRHSTTINGAALWNFNVDSGFMPALFRTLLKIEKALKGSDVPSALAIKLTFDDWNNKFAPNRTDFDWLSRDEAEVDKYVADPLCGFPVSIGMWLDVLATIGAGTATTKMKTIPSHLPFHLIGGGADPCSDFGKAVVRYRDVLKVAGVDDITCQILPDTRHETLNETNRDKSITGFIAWLDQRWG